MSTLDGGAREDVMVKQQEGIKDRSGFLYWRSERWTRVNKLG